MDDTRRADGRPDPTIAGPLSREAAEALLERGAELVAAGDFGAAGGIFARVIGFDDASITAAAMMGLGEARYRLDDEEGALATWLAVPSLGETPSTYDAWRKIAGARVRAGDLPGAVEAYREADRRAPREDKAEIATRLGWLAKETGNSGASRRYFARGRGDTPVVTMSLVLIVLTSIVSLLAMYAQDGQAISNLLQLDKPAVAAGEYWRLWTVTLLHGGLLHLGFNMYALWLAGPIVERWYGRVRFLAFYLACAAAGSVGSFLGSDIPSVGASGAIFGLFGILLIAGRLHHPVDRQARALVSQIGMLIVLNLALGFASGGAIDNAAHLGGLISGIWLGALILPTGVPTLSSLWHRPSASPSPGPGRPLGATAYMAVVAIGVVAVVVAAGVAIGTAERRPAGGSIGPPIATLAENAVAEFAVGSAADFTVLAGGAAAQR